MSSANSWSPQHEDSQMEGHIGLQNAMSFSDEYDEVGDLIDLPSMAGSSGGLGHLSGMSGEKPIRRRSSKGASPIIHLMSSMFNLAVSYVPSMRPMS